MISSATATLVSTSKVEELPLVGIAQQPNDVVIYLCPACRNQQHAVSLYDGVVGERLDTQPGAFHSDLDFTRSKPEVVAQRLRYNQPSCLVNGCSHTIKIPFQEDK